EQLGQGPDPVQGRVDGMLGPAGHDGPLDLPQPVTYVGGHRAAPGPTSRQIPIAAITLGSLLPAGLGPYRLAGGSASSRPVRRAISACAAASRSRLLATTAAGARSTNDVVASFRSVAAASSSTVTPQACTDAVGANASPGTDSRSRARIAASWPASGVPPIPVSAAGTGWVGRSPWSERNRRTSVTSCISAVISASAAGSAKAARSPPAGPPSADRALAGWPGHGAVITLSPPVSARHSSSVTNGITGCSSRSSRSSTKPSTARVAATALSSPLASAGLASSRYQSQNSSQAKWYSPSQALPNSYCSSRSSVAAVTAASRDRIHR